ncbi:MAG: ThuA domain-containing protein, partial [Ginsengibacter sp.]
HYILAVDESSYNPNVEWANRNKKGTGMGKFHPIAWYHNYDGGRAFYTALGHMPADFSDPAFLNHIYAGIFWLPRGKNKCRLSLPVIKKALPKKFYPAY